MTAGADGNGTGTAAETETAVQAARAAFDSWSTCRWKPGRRISRQDCGGVKARTDELAGNCRGVGMPLKVA
jgi:acyl-CoA reductase-like NAD-dependent aldehyde dehydrogenase